jgi:hypothetical protein
MPLELSQASDEADQRQTLREVGASPPDDDPNPGKRRWSAHRTSQMNRP